MDTSAVQPQGCPEFAAVQRIGNAAYDEAIASGNESACDAYRNMTGFLTAQLKAGELWLCPACNRELAPTDALCTFCESEERDGHADTQAQSRLRNGRG